MSVKRNDLMLTDCDTDATSSSADAKLYPIPVRATAPRAPYAQAGCQRRSSVVGVAGLAARGAAVIGARRVAVRPEARDAARFGLVGVDRERVVVAAARMRRRDRCSRRARARPRCRRGRTPAAPARRSSDAAPTAGSRRGSARRRRIRRGMPVGVSGSARPLQVDAMPIAGHPGDLDLQALDRRIDVARGAGAAHLLAQHVPRLDRLAQFDASRRRSSPCRSAESGIRRRARTTRCANAIAEAR